MTTYSPTPLPELYLNLNQVASYSALPLYMSTIDFDNGLRPIAWIPARLREILLEADELGLKHDHDERGPILEYHGRNTSDTAAPAGPERPKGYWTLPCARQKHCLNCVTEHMRRFARVCEEAFGLEKLTDSKRFEIRPKCRRLLRIT